MLGSFRHSMAWVHTWFGLVLGFVLMVCFFFGSLSVFDREIDRWAIPETRFPAQPMPSYDEMLAQAFTHLRAHPDALAAAAGRVHGAIPHPDTLPLTSLYAYTTHRDPVVSIGGEFTLPNKPKNASVDHDHVRGWATVDPRTGTLLPEGQWKVGSEFFYPLHYSLHLEWHDLGYWIVGLAALIMMAALVSGVVIHRRIFREFFTFRPRQRTQRSVLDLHNLTGVVALPFHFFFALTGLVIFAGIYLPIGDTMFRSLAKQHEAVDAARKGLPHEPADVRAPIASVDAMVAEAKRRWALRGAAGEVGWLTIEHLGDRNSYVGVYRSGVDRVASVGEGIHFEATTGHVLREDPPLNAVNDVNEFLIGLHLQHFRHWLLRWLYVLGGLLGCVCIATGFIFFVAKRKHRHAQQGSQGARVVEALAVTTVTGMVIATAGILVANRLLPTSLPSGWLARDALQEYAFWGVWVLAMAHAFWRSSPPSPGGIAPAWREQCVAIAVLAVAAVILNWITTGDHLVRTIRTGYWPVAGVDCALFVSALVAAAAARTLTKRAASPPAFTNPKPGAAHA